MMQTIFLLVLSALILLLPIFGVLPPVKTNQKDTKNTILLVKMKPREWFAQRDSNYEATLAQEKAEWYLRWVLMITLGLIGYFSIGHWGAYLGGLALGAVMTAMKPIYKQLDLMGRAVEVVVADTPGYLEAEALRLKRGFNKNFESYSVEKLTQMIRARMPVAKVLARLS